MVTTQVPRSPHRYRCLNWRAAANALILDVNAFKIIQIAVKHSVMGVVTWQFLGHQCIRLECLAAGWRLVQLGTMLLDYMENVKIGSAAIAKIRSGIYVSWILLSARNLSNSRKNGSWLRVSSPCHAMPRARMIYDCSQDNVSSPLPVRFTLYYWIVEQETESRRALHGSRRIHT